MHAYTTHTSTIIHMVSLRAWKFSTSVWIIRPSISSNTILFFVQMYSLSVRSFLLLESCNNFIWIVKYRLSHSIASGFQGNSLLLFAYMCVCVWQTECELGRWKTREKKHEKWNEKKTCSTPNLMIISKWWMRMLYKFVGNHTQNATIPTQYEGHFPQKLQLFQRSCVLSVLYLFYTSYAYPSLISIDSAWITFIRVRIRIDFNDLHSIYNDIRGFCCSIWTGLFSAHYGVATLRFRNST